MSEPASHSNTASEMRTAELRAQERRDFRNYLWGFIAALALTLAPFTLVNWHVLPRFGVLVAIGALAILQLLVHFRCFLHIRLNQRRDDLQLIVFSALLLIIMIGGTMWIMTSLALRM